MNYYNVKYLKDGNPQGRPYAFKTELELSEGDMVELEGGKHGQICGAADMEMVNQYGAYRLKSIVKKVSADEIDNLCKQFLSECFGMHTTVAVFIRLFNLWSRLDSKQRSKIIAEEIDSGRMSVER